MLPVSICQPTCVHKYACYILDHLMPKNTSLSSEKAIPELRKMLKPRLSQHFFKRSPSRILYLLAAYIMLALHVLVTQLATSGELLWGFFILSLFICVNTSSFFFFFFHEVLHGAVVRRGRAMKLLGFLSGAPTLCAPAIWSRWHNLHHAKTAGAEDPDRARHQEYDDYSKLRTRIHAALKRFHLTDLPSYIVPFGVIMGHHFMMYIDMVCSKRNPIRLRVQLSLEYLLVLVLFISPSLILPIETAILGVYLPLILGQMICNLYILSNHNSRLLTRKNLPLLNSLSVHLHKNSPITHMGFGRHVEHHIFPEVGHNRLKELTPILREKFPDSYSEVSLTEALKAIYTRKHKEQQIV